jgi:hypothetical protein
MDVLLVAISLQVLAIMLIVALALAWVSVRAWWAAS